MFAAPGICAISTRIINGYYVFPSSSFRDSDTSNKSEATYIHLTGGRRQNEICGKLKITQQIGDKLCKTVSNQWPHYALVVELQGQLTTTNSLGARCQIPLPQLVPEENSELICNSKIFTLVSGEENGLKKQLDLKECPRSCLVRNPATFPFKLQLPENHDQLPSTIQCPNIFIEYFLVAYLRTEHGYEEVDKRALQRFRGHNLVPKFPSISESFSVVFPVDFSDSLSNLEGEEEIFVGTGTLAGDKVPRDQAKGAGLFSRMRSQSVSSLLSLFPPSYSRVPSRRASLTSLETLPPHYDDILKETT
ncbi:hypothetical protein Fcan01_19945 [Folsomia candida]|uniref:Uncharacterized protein n=1 Tax=Folsomia candida TaxID=158441 RepID=A0A226DJF2_FOLCA|nr:hypothetical protein Fcan01_19945 [Folsomia candida]